MIKKKFKKFNKALSCTSYNISKQRDKIILSPKIVKGNLLSYGCLNLTLTIELNEKDLNQYNINWEKITNYDSLSFISENNTLWPRIKLSSTNDTLKILLHMNKILEKKIKIKHICFRKIKYDQHQSQFQTLIKTITNNNGLYLDSHSVCPCELSIQLRLRYNGRRRLFVLSGEKTPLDDDNDEDGEYDIKQEEDNILLEEGTNYDDIAYLDNCQMEKYDIDEKMENEDYNPFIDIPKEINNVNEFYFIYFNYEDYNGNGKNIFKGKITNKYLYNYFLYIRKNFRNNKIVLNVGFDIPKMNIDDRDLLAITNIAIFYEKNKLFQILNNLKTEEEKMKREKEYFRHYYDNKIKTQEIKRYLEEEDKRANFLEYLQRKSYEKNFLDDKNNTLNEEYYFSLFRNTFRNKNLYSIELSKKQLNLIDNNQKENEKKVIIKDNKYLVPLSKAEMFSYYKKEICEKCLLIKSNKEKMIIVLDELSKLYIVQFNPNYDKPFVLDLDLNLYQKINVHNINKVLSYKEIIKYNIEEYIILYIGYLLSSLVSLSSFDYKVSEEAALYIGYYGGQKILKEIVQKDKDDVTLPENDNFYLPNLSKEEINDLINQAERRKKEIKFILDSNNKNASKLKLYNPLLDKYASSYINNIKNKTYFKRNGFITEGGRLLYDPVYRESLNVNKNEKKVKNEEDLIKTCHEVKTKNNFKMKEIECLNNYKNKNVKLTTFIAGFKRKKPEYDIYLKEYQEQKLPNIKKNHTYNNSEYNTPIKYKSYRIFNMKSVGKKTNMYDI